MSSSRIKKTFQTFIFFPLHKPLSSFKNLHRHFQLCSSSLSFSNGNCYHHPTEPTRPRQRHVAALPRLRLPHGLSMHHSGLRHPLRPGLHQPPSILPGLLLRDGDPHRHRRHIGRHAARLLAGALRHCAGCLPRHPQPVADRAGAAHRHHHLRGSGGQRLHGGAAGEYPPGGEAHSPRPDCALICHSFHQWRPHPARHAPPPPCGEHRPWCCGLRSGPPIACPQPCLLSGIQTNLHAR